MIGGMSMPKMNDLFSPSPFLHTQYTWLCYYIFFREQKGGEYLTRTTGKRDTGCLASQLKRILVEVK